MDKPIISGWAVLGALLAGEIVCIIHLRSSWVCALVLALGLIGQGIHLYFLYQQKRMVEYLIMEKKKKAGKAAVYWDEDEADKLNLMKKRVELHTLQNQINPHFLYNTLDCIRSRALLDGQREIASMTEILSKFFRYCISRSGSLVKIREEMNHIQDYYYIQKYRFEDRFDMSVQVESEEIYDYYIPRLTLQPLVENAMVHGIEKVNRKGHLELRLFMTDEKIVIVVSDNGNGMDMQQLDKLNDRMNKMYYEGGKTKKHNSIAVTNVNARIKLTFGPEFGIHYRSLQNEGTDAIVCIPKINDFTRNKYEDELEK